MELVILLEIAIFWLFFSIVAAIIAGQKGRSGIGFFFLSLFLSPIIGIIAALASSPDTEKLEQRELRSGRSKRCPHCAEIVKAQAVICRFCGRELNVISEPIPSIPEVEPSDNRTKDVAKKQPLAPTLLAALFVVFVTAALLFFTARDTTTAPLTPMPRFTPVPEHMWTHTARLKVNDESGRPMGTDAHVWVEPFRINLDIACTIPRGQLVEVSPQRVINDSIRVKNGACEGWIGVIQLDQIEPK